jgi:hypothetical protein
MASHRPKGAQGRHQALVQLAPKDQADVVDQHHHHTRGQADEAHQEQQVEAEGEAPGEADEGVVQPVRQEKLAQFRLVVGPGDDVQVEVQDLVQGGLGRGPLGRLHSLRRLSP